MAWWQKAVIYEVYPRSFQDTDGDGVGDLEGIRRRLDYLAWLGVDAIWICPIFSSPMIDHGYDVSDYCRIDPLFGSGEEFDRLLAEAHGRGLKIVLDYVPNHTSDQHPWFVESRSSRTSPKRDWYVWRDAAPDGSPPTNWTSHFGGSAWEWDEATGQFYYHAFLKEQPDLDWRNPEVRQAMHGVLRFWLDRGVDGFRVDAITGLVEDALLRDDPPDRTGPRQLEGIHLERAFTEDRPETHSFVAGMRAVLDEYEGRVLIGEAHLPVARLMAYYGGPKPGFDLPFNFILLHTPWDARSVEAAIDQYTILLPEGAWPNWVLGNHDEARVASRIGEDQARVAAMLLMTLQGTPFVYYGDELGLPDSAIPPGQVHDPATHGRGQGRDPQRTPMPWDGSRNGGFTTGTPWLPLGGAHETRNVADLRADERSILSLYRRLIALRKSEPALAEGRYEAMACRGQVLAYRRAGGDQDLLVALNFAGAEQIVALPRRGRVALSTGLDRDETVEGSLHLRPHEGVVVDLTGP